MTYKPIIHENTTYYNMYGKIPVKNYVKDDVFWGVQTSIGISIINMIVIPIQSYIDELTDEI